MLLLVVEKVCVVQVLDFFGVYYIEVGFFSLNLKEVEFFWLLVGVEF